MNAEMIIRGGRVFDAEAERFIDADVAVCGTKIAAVGDLSGDEATIEYDASGKLVVPGLVDFHIHLFTDASDEGVPADLALLPYGVTSAVEGGSAGVSTYSAFRRINRNNSMVSLKANLNVSSLGILNGRLFENTKPENYEEERLIAVSKKYRSELFGLKLRYSLDMDPEMPVDALNRCLDIAEKMEMPLVVHVTNPPVDMEEIARKLRPGDVFCHCFQARGHTILGPDGKIKEAVWDAKKRGVIFDACNGSSNYSHEIAEEAIREGFYPDMISTDGSHVFHSYLKPRCFALPYIMSKYLAMGMTLEQVLKRTTWNAAKLAGWTEKGKLQKGFDADIAIFSVEEKVVSFADHIGNARTGSQLLVPLMTIKDGTIVFRQMFDC